MERRLSAIMAADVVGYSRLMGEDEDGTLIALKAHREELIDPTVSEHHGRIVKLMGDGALVEFPSVTEAVQCAIEVQKGMMTRNAGVPEDKRIQFRIGVNLGDIIVEGDDIYGDGVNVAARLETLAAPNGICISDVVHQSVEGKLGVSFEDLGEREVKNIAKPLHVFRIALERKLDTRDVIGPYKKNIRWRWVVGVGVFFAVLTIGGLVAWMVLESGQSASEAAGCTDHLGLPVPEEECPKNPE